MDAVVLVVIGLVTGVLSASLGIGGGVVFVPGLAIVLGFSQHLAQGTSLAVVLPTAIVGTIVHARNRRIDWSLGVRLVAGALVGGWLGAWAALQLDETLLRRLFAILLIIVAVRMLLRTRTH